MDLMGTLGLDKVENSDNLPDSKYAGVIYKCEYLISKAGNLGIAIIYKVADPASKFHGREKFEWWGIGKNGRQLENGDFHTDEPNMPEAQKEWFNKRLAAIGIPQSKLSSLSQDDLKSRVGMEVYFGIKNKDGYNNVNFVELRNQTANAGSVDPFQTGYLEGQTSTPQATTPTTPSGTNLADQI